MFCNLLGCPAAGRKHGDGKLGGGQIIGHIMSCHWVMNSTPSGRETVSDIDDPFKIFRPFRLDNCLQHGPQKPVVLSETFNEIIRTGNLPCRQQMSLGPVRLFQAHIVHNRYQM